MELTRKEMREAELALTKILNNPMDVKLSYRMIKIANQFSTEINSIEKKRLALIDSYGEEEFIGEGDKKKSTGRRRVTPKNTEVFAKEYEEILNEKIEINIAKIPMEVLSTIKLSPVELLSIEKFVEEPLSS